MSAPPSETRAQQACTGRRLSIRPAGEKERQREGTDLRQWGWDSQDVSIRRGCGGSQTGAGVEEAEGHEGPHAGPGASVLCAGTRLTWLLTQNLGNCLTHWTPAAPPPWPPTAQPGPSPAPAPQPAQGRHPDALGRPETRKPGGSTCPSRAFCCPAGSSLNLQHL